MYSNPDKERFLSFDRIYKICKEIKDKTIIQLEGGEPLTHPQFVLILEYLSILPIVEEIVIDTNAFLLENYIDKIVEIAERNKKLIHIKSSFNNYLKSIYDKNHHIKFVDYLKNLITSCEFLEYIKFTINVRGYRVDELKELEEELGDIMKEYISSYLFNSYGLLKENKGVPEIIINKVYDDWYCINSEGKNFKQDLIARSESEK